MEQILNVIPVPVIFVKLHTIVKKQVKVKVYVVPRLFSLAASLSALDVFKSFCESDLRMSSETCGQTVEVFRSDAGGMDRAYLRLALVLRRCTRA